MRNQIDFLLGESTVSVSGLAPEITVLDWLRSNGRVGTKEGCAEGDCGACTVVVAEVHGTDLRYRAVNSCIQPMVSLDGRQLITVEDLARHSNNGALELHPVQEAMVEHHGSQCGFCTPGFVMSMFAMSHSPRFEGYTGRETGAIRDALAGNLCRCTGYVPIVQASRNVLMTPQPDQFSALQAEAMEKLQSIRSQDSIRISADGRQMLVPRKLDELLELLARYPDAVLVAGATDVGLWLTKDLKQFDTMIYLGDVAELLETEVGSEYIDIGAAVSYSDAMPVLVDYFPHMEAMLKRLGGLQVRNAGTIGGNIANGSPIGDMPPALIALNSKLILTSTKKSREMEVQEFFIEYGEQDLRPGEIVHKIRIPLPSEKRYFRVYKLSKRFDQDITSVLGAYSLALEGETVSDIRIAYGGMAGIPARASACENALIGQPWNTSSIESACHAIQEDFSPLSDWRASAEYRMLAAQNLLRRFYLETSGEASV